MRRIVLALLVLAPPGGAIAGPLLTTEPLDRLATARYEVEYLRPWGDLPVQRGRVGLGLPLGGQWWSGITAEGWRAPTVQELGLGIWAQPRRWVRAEFLYREIRVDAISRTARFVTQLDLALRRRTWAVGAWATHTTDPYRAVLRRSVWASYESGAASFFVARHSQPWTGLPALEAGISVDLFGRVRAGVHWRESGAELSFGWSRKNIALLSSTAWTGPRTGAFGLRVAGTP